MPNASEPVWIWLVDDTSHHHEVVRATVARTPGFAFRGFFSGTEALDAFVAAVQAGRGVPVVVLMDYFLGGEHGDQVTEALRGLAGGGRPRIIGFSSVRRCSEAIVSAGGDGVLRKHSVGGVNPSLQDYLAGLPCGA